MGRGAAALLPPVCDVASSCLQASVGRHTALAVPPPLPAPPPAAPGAACAGGGGEPPDGGRSWLADIAISCAEARPSMAPCAARTLLSPECDVSSPCVPALFRWPAAAAAGPPFRVSPPAAAAAGSAWTDGDVGSSKGDDDRRRRRGPCTWVPWTMADVSVHWRPLLVGEGFRLHELIELLSSKAVCADLVLLTAARGGPSVIREVYPRSALGDVAAAIDRGSCGDLWLINVATLKPPVGGGIFGCT